MIMNVDKYGFPIFDEDYDNPEIHGPNITVIKETSVDTVELTIDINDIKPKEKKEKMETLF